MPHPQFPTPILSATLGQDDVTIAQEWLQTPRTHWYEKQLVNEWQDEFANWLDIKQTFAFMGGRASLYAVVQALNLQPQDEVIIPAFTCQAVVNAYRFHGVIPRYADIELQTYGLDIDSVKKMYTSKCKAIMLQYTFGLVSRDIEALVQFAREKQLYIIEDCAHALGASYKEQKLGTLGDIAIFSSERSKIINTIHGGIVATNNQNLIERMQQIYKHAPLPSEEKIERLLNTVIQNYGLYHQDAQTTNLVTQQFTQEDVLPQMFEDELRGEFSAHYQEKMCEPVAALSLNQFEKKDKFHIQRMEASKKWDAWCDALGYAKPLVIKGSIPTFLRYPVLVAPEKKKNLSWIEKELNITAGVWFTSACHPAPLEPENCPNGARAAKECINLPTIL